MEEKKQTEPVLEPLATAQEVEQAIEAILFAAGHPMRYDKMAEVLSLTVKDVNAAIRRIADPSKMTFVLAADLAKAREAGKDFSKQ